MISDISEFTFGYSVIENLVFLTQKQTLSKPPKFLSLREEGRKGYDVKITYTGYLLYLQFKLSDCLNHKLAREYKDCIINIPYYRFGLRTLSTKNQHLSLFNLANKTRTDGSAVLYIAPEFHKFEEFKNCYFNNSIISNTAAFNVLDIGKLDNTKIHHIVFEKYSDFGFVCSNEKHGIKKYKLDEDINKITDALTIKPNKINSEYLKKSLELMLDVLVQWKLDKTV